MEEKPLQVEKTLRHGEKKPLLMEKKPLLMEKKTAPTEESTPQGRKL